MDVLTLLACAGCLAAGAVAGRVRWLHRDEPAGGTTSVDPAVTLARRRAESRALELTSTNELLRAACLASPAGEVAPALRPVPSARELEALVSTLRGFAFVDEVVVAGPDGLTWSRGESPRARRLSALTTAFGALASTLREQGSEIGEVQLVTADSKHVVARRLPAWTGGAWLIAQSTSRAPSALALDAVVARAGLLRPPSAARDSMGPVGRLRGTTGRSGEGGSRVQTLVEELSRLRTARDASVVAFTHAGRPLVTLLEDGPPASFVEELTARMHRLHRHLARALGVAVVHTGATLTSGARIAFVPLVDHSQCALLTVGMHPVEALDIERFAGRVRRLLAETGDLAPRLLAPAEGASVR